MTSIYMQRERIMKRRALLIMSAALMVFAGCARRPYTPAPVVDPVVNPVVEEVIYNVTSSKMFDGAGATLQTDTYVYEEGAVTITTAHHDTGDYTSTKYTFNANGELSQYAYSDDGSTWDVVYDIYYNDVENYYYGYAEYVNGVAEADYVYVSYPSNGTMALDFYENDVQSTTYEYVADYSGWYYLTYAADHTTGQGYTYSNSYDATGYITGATITSTDGYESYVMDYYYE